MNRRSLKLIIPFAVLSVVLIFTAADLKLSILLFSPQNMPGLFFDAFGGWPSPIFGLLASAALISTCKRTGRNAKFYFALFGLLAAAGGTITIYLPLYYAYRLNFSPMFIIPGTMLALLAILLFRGLPQTCHMVVRSASYAVILVILSQLLTITLLKTFWGRIRFRDMEAPFLLFTPWYLPQGITGGTSFPSGHTGNAAVSFSLIYLRYLKPKRRILPILWAPPLAWTCLVASSRVILGYHFATDVIISCIIVLALILIFDHLILKRKYK